MKLQTIIRNSIVLILCITLLTSATTINATAKKKAKHSNRSYAVINEDQYRKTLCKGFLGKSYRSVVDGIRCDCSGYTKAALQRMKSTKQGAQSFKEVHVTPRCTSSWMSGSKITFTNKKVIKGSLTWNSKKTKVKVGKKDAGVDSVNALELGDVLMYGHRSSSSHIAIYFGKFNSIEDVKNYLVSLGIYKKGDLKKSSDGKYLYHGRTIIRNYTNSSYWRIHSTNKGIMIDNDISSKSPYTSSFGKWIKTFDTGIKAAS